MDRKIISLIRRAGPWLLALAPAWFVYDSMIHSFQVPVIIALPVAAGVELTGISAIYTALRLRSYNRRKLKSDPAAPAALALALVIGYVIAGIVLTAVIKQQWEISLFFALAAIAYGTIALEQDHDERESTAIQAKAERKRPRTSAERPANVQPTDPANDERLMNVRRTIGERPFKRVDVQVATGTGKTTAAALIRYGITAGTITKNGNSTYKWRIDNENHLD
jgi:hypothetical protein